ncbi:MAG: GTPase Era [Bacteroidales bacterium]
MTTPTHKAGFVNIIGKPNAGKSTLLNILVSEPLAIVTSKAQTTRHRLLGIVNDDHHQIIYSDTPGVLEPAYKLHESMMSTINEAFEDADVLLIIQASHDKAMDANLLEKICKSEKPVIFLLNKIDLHKQEEVQQTIDYWEETLSHAHIIPVSALHKFNTDKVEETVRQLIPQSPPYYDKDTLTDKPVRFFISEIIREKILLQYRKEIPYSVEVEVEEFKDTGPLVRIRANIYIERESQRKIMIGTQGKAIKGLGIDARKSIEKFIEKKIFLDLSIKISKDWRNDDQKLKRFGYTIEKP